MAGEGRRAVLVTCMDIILYTGIWAMIGQIWASNVSRGMAVIISANLVVLGAGVAASIWRSIVERR